MHLNLSFLTSSGDYNLTLPFIVLWCFIYVFSLHNFSSWDSVHQIFYGHLHGWRDRISDNVMITQYGLICATKYDFFEIGGPQWMAPGIQTSKKST